ncbi:iron ABC transporter permease [Schnuerera sp. xch1]|uniref:iron ABC transporter permease n=1 Tax=Schnuerera sp. xch1 TaxID=2874283 RepID=UPI001CBF88DF|nr:iron ABC transporter permease [Schnuerera sp. xch1]MBZ2174651.1 iron ABC transporter permease [Schnuerera sp. xch1]
MSSKIENKYRLLLLTMIIGGLLSLFILSFIHINQGSVGISLKVILESLINPKNIIEHNVIRDLRLPRLIIGMIAGGALGISGALFQSIMRNPLASASTLGINAGAYFSVSLFTIFLPNFTVIPFFPALAGALGTAIIVMNLGGGRKANPVQMTLAGVALSLVFSSMTSALQILFENETKGLFLWGSGSLVQTSWRGINFSFPIVSLCLFFSLVIASKIDILELGDDIATSLGLRVNLYRYIGIAIGVVATSSVIAVVGPIGFVGLVAPHIMKRIGFKKHIHIFILSFIWGAVILIGADVLSRLFTKGSYELPVGAFTAIIGAPWLIYLAYKTGKHIEKTPHGLLVQVSKKRLPYSILTSILLISILIVFFISLRYGGQEYSIKEIIETILGNGNGISNMIINKVRLPRVLTALLAGIVLAVSGFLLQTVLNNTLADPSTLGVTPGSALGALFTIYFLPKMSNIMIPISAFIGAILASFVIFGISKKSKYNPSMLVLVGMAVTALCQAGVNIIIINTTVGKSASLVWLAGSTYASTWNNVVTLLVSMLIMLPIAWLLCKDLDAIMLGQDVATAIGSDVTRIRILASVVGIFLSAVAVSTVGTVGFIGLLAPHMARFLVGVKHRKSLPIVSLLGGLLLLSANFIGSTIIYPNEIPSGLIVSVIGAPYFLWLLYSTSKIKR